MKDNPTEYHRRRWVVRGCLMLLAAGFTDLGALAQEDSKAAQSLVQYRDKPNGAAKCSGCVNFVAPDACKTVAGKIDPEGWCLLFALKSS